MILNRLSGWYYPVRLSIILVLGLLLYYQTFAFGFVFDDYQFIVNNPSIKNVDLLNTIWGSFPKTRMVGMYSFALNYQMNQLNPFGYHVVNFIIHLIAVLLVWAVASRVIQVVTINNKQMIKNNDLFIQEAPFIIAVLFLVHPANTQAVTYIAQRFESIATVCYLTSVFCYITARVSQHLRTQVIFFTLSFIAAVAGIFSKEVVASLPLMLFAIEYILFSNQQRRINQRHMVIALAVCSLVLFVLFRYLVNAGMNVFTSHFMSESHDGDMITFGNYLLTQMRVFLTFLRLLIFPINQNLEYDYPVSVNIINPPLTLVGLMAIVACLGLIIKYKKKQPIMAFGLAWILITFFMNLIPRTNVIFEHKLYLISTGFFILMVFLLRRYVTNGALLVGVLVGVISILAVATIERNKVWRNELVLWEDVATKSPYKARVLANLGRAYGNNGRTVEAIDALTQAIALNPADDISYQNRGILQGQLGQYDKALSDLDHAIALMPNYPVTYIKRAYIYMKLKDYAKAEADLNRSIALQPSAEDSYIQRALLWIEVGDMHRAQADLANALRLNPLNAQVRAQYLEISSKIK